jgi:hypothetical protein
VLGGIGIEEEIKYCIEISALPGIIFNEKTSFSRAWDPIQCRKFSIYTDVDYFVCFLAKFPFRENSCDSHVPTARFKDATHLSGKLYRILLPRITSLII